MLYYYQMSIRDILRGKLNARLYNDQILNDLSNFLVSISKYEVHNPINLQEAIDSTVQEQTNITQPNKTLFGGNESSLPVTDGGSVERFEDIRFKITDTFAEYNTNTVMYGKKITPYAKLIIFNVIRYYNSKDISESGLKGRIIKYLNKLFKSEHLDYDILMRKFNAQTTECLLAYMLIAFQNNSLDLMLRTMYTFGRVLPMNKKSDWFDNYRLNAYGNVLNMVMWKKYDKPDVYTINSEPEVIDKSVSINFAKAVKYFVGSLRAFIIDEELYPNTITTSNIESLNNVVQYESSINKYDAVKRKHKQYKHNEMYGSKRFKDLKLKLGVIGGDIADIIAPREYKSKDINSNNKSAEDICDECYLHYPYFFGGAHGCDVFDLGYTLTIDEIKAFLNRYPSAHVGYILNTATYKSGKGEHWVALEFTKGSAKLICSQCSDFSCFKDGGKLRSAIRSAGFGEEYNSKKIQIDNYSCGSWSFCSLLELLRYGDIRKAVDAMGVNLTNFGKEIGKSSNSDLVRKKIVGFKEDLK